MLKPITVILLAGLLACSPEKSFVDEAEDESDARAAEPPIFELLQNSPNPFQTATLIRYRVEKTMFVNIRANLRGSGNINIVNEVKEGPATHYVVFTAPSHTPSGDYRYTMTVFDRYQVRVMTIAR